MDANEPRVRRRGFFLHTDTGEPDTGEHENPEGFVVRVGLRRSAESPRSRAMGASGARISGGRQSRTESMMEEERVGIRSGNVTGSRQRAHSPR
jgi:hypothetical protein